MNWQSLFSTKRLNDSPGKTYSNERSQYEIDFDRVVFSSAFRRLQDKTQVIPLPENDFVHSRLTHSLEVSCVGRSLGRMVGEKIISKYDLQNISVSDFGAVVAAACLTHDIGNPPFGHSGEGAISEYFRNGKGKEFKNEIGDIDKWTDLINFEGNANGFRLLTNSNSASGGGVMLTYTTLAAFTKYPCKSYKGNDNENKKRASQGKYGFFQSEKMQMEKIFTDLGITKLGESSWMRHPLAFLVEAADDICYRIIDFEDGVRIGLVPFHIAEEKLISILPKEGSRKFNKDSYEKINDNREKLGYLRAKVINHLINEAAGEFISNEEKILSGEYDEHLCERISCTKILDEIKWISIRDIYNSESVLQIEISGFSVVAELLDLFINAVNDVHRFGKKTKTEKLLSWKMYNLLPKQYLANNEQPDEDLYNRIMQICEFVASMTDGHAMNLYKRLKGIELPHE